MTFCNDGVHKDEMLYKGLYCVHNPGVLYEHDRLLERVELIP